MHAYKLFFNPYELQVGFLSFGLLRRVYYLCIFFSVFIFIGESFWCDYAPFFFQHLIKYFSAAPNHSSFTLKDLLLLSLVHVYFQLSYAGAFKAPCVSVCLCLCKLLGSDSVHQDITSLNCLHAGDHAGLFFHFYSEKWHLVQNFLQLV